VAGRFANSDRQIATLAYQRTGRSKVAPSQIEASSASDLENALIGSLEQFLLESGNDFAFVPGQKRLRVGTGS
jgi:predicted nuclease of restriction endonuclease-like (RecB) superfamily